MTVLSKTAVIINNPSPLVDNVQIFHMAMRVYLAPFEIYKLVLYCMCN